MTATLGNCRRCGKLYLRIRNICDQCFQKQEDDFLKVSEYLRDFPGVTIHALSEATEVSVGQIREFIMAERIIAGHFPNLAYPCETCGSMIKSGTKCQNCFESISKLAKQMDQKGPEVNGDKSKKKAGYISDYL
ncbi:flagellar protein [Bacillus sp. BRMEA1]|uniref:flagellar protein n=1 Tax=Neobacillus endophyticus TaxID=2738405 RepID=UPI0015632990|nr:flagellar protein [Neobacillus endophyticus]NRD79368.1 flagellar protein [Neobacillus endophyticus]